jgi:hypothetical protein
VEERISMNKQKLKLTWIGEGIGGHEDLQIVRENSTDE